MRAFQRLLRLKITAKLASVVAAALVALCVMGAIAVLASWQLEYSAHELEAETAQFLSTQMEVAVAVESAIGEVHSAPSELDLDKMKVKEERLKAALGTADRALQQTLAVTVAPDVLASGKEIVSAIANFSQASAKVFYFAGAFDQPNALATLANAVAPAEASLHAALGHFRTAADASSAAREAAIAATTRAVTAIVVGLAVFLVAGLAALAYAIVSRGVVRPLIAIKGVMMRLSTGDRSIDVPYLARLDEIGDMAKAMQVFKEACMDRDRLAGEHEAEQQVKERRANTLETLIRGFETSVGGIVNVVSSAANELEFAASTLTQTADTTQQLSATVANASEEASSNVQSVATATEEMNTSVGEIARQVHESSRIAGEAVAQAQQTDRRIAELSHAAQRIGDVVKLITAIAEQTNLLALNATIEAARAGEAGRGFAVVAQEVKALAAQTAKATDEIGTQIAGMQTATRDSVADIKEIGATIGRISGIVSAIATAVEEQGVTTQEIARNVQKAAHGTSQVATNIGEVSKGAGETGSASAQVLASARSLSGEGSRLKAEVEKFLATVRAA
jgi:methyl-accepting chemotaxis protein